MGGIYDSYIITYCFNIFSSYVPSKSGNEALIELLLNRFILHSARNRRIYPF